jgi:hypothetical protein
LSFGGKNVHRIMSAHLSGILLALVMVGLGAFAFFEPLRLVKQAGTPEEIEKRARSTRSGGVVMFVAGFGLLVFELLKWD